MATEGTSLNVDTSDILQHSLCLVAYHRRLMLQPVACRDLREGLKQASKAAEQRHTEEADAGHPAQPSDPTCSLQQRLPSITLSVSPRQSFHRANQGPAAADKIKGMGLPLVRATSPPQLVGQFSAAGGSRVGQSLCSTSAPECDGSRMSALPAMKTDASQLPAIRHAFRQGQRQSQTIKGGQAATQSLAFALFLVLLCSRVKCELACACTPFPLYCCSHYGQRSACNESPKQETQAQTQAFNTCSLGRVSRQRAVEWCNVVQTLLVAASLTWQHNSCGFLTHQVQLQ